MMTAREIILGLPDRIDKSAVEDKETLFHILLSGEGGGNFSLDLKNGILEISEELKGDPKCTVKTDAESFVKLVKKEANPMLMLLTGKVKIDNQGELLKYAKIFGLM
jgi:putative sterol carrier protein